MREAVDILGDALAGARDDGALNDAFTLADTALEHIEIVSGSLLRSNPRPFLVEIALGELRDEDAGAVRAYDESRLEGRIGLDVNQRMASLRAALRLMRKAQINLDAAFDAEREAINHIPEDIRWSEWTIVEPYDHIGDACEALSGAIETVRILTGLPPNPLKVLHEKNSALTEVIEEERNRTDAGIPEVRRLKEEHDRLEAGRDSEMRALVVGQSISFEEAVERSKATDKYAEARRLDEAMNQIRKTDDRYAEVRRLCAERNLLWEEMKRIGSPLEAVAARRGGFMVINGGP